MALQEAAKLINERQGSVVSQPEMEIVKKVAAGRSNECEVTDSVLIASGINDPQKRQKYAEKIDHIVDDASQAISRFETQEDKAKALAKYLRKVPLHGGYVSLQGNMALLLNEGTYNCVSSAILYYVVGGRLGIKTQPEQAPNHVFLKMGDTFIEPTGGKAQSEDDHQEFIDELWAEAKPTDPLIYGNKQYRPTNKMGLVGEIYIDGASKAKDKVDQSAVLALKACCMCPTNPLYANPGQPHLKWRSEQWLAGPRCSSQRVCVSFSRFPWICPV